MTKEARAQSGPVSAAVAATMILKSARSLASPPYCAAVIAGKLTSNDTRGCSSGFNAGPTCASAAATDPPPVVAVIVAAAAALAAAASAAAMATAGSVTAVTWKDTARKLRDTLGWRMDRTAR